MEILKYKQGLNPNSRNGFKKGQRFSDKHRKNISKANKGKVLSEETKNKIKENNCRFWLGKKRPAMLEESKKKISDSIKKLMTEDFRRKRGESRKGEKCNFWKGGVSKENHKIRNSIEIRLWREAVFARDNWTCQKTGFRGGYLIAHHINNFADFPELRFAINNGITLSKKSHKEFHKKYGFKNNTKEQLDEFLNLC